MNTENYTHKTVTCKTAHTLKAKLYNIDEAEQQLVEARIEDKLAKEELIKYLLSERMTSCLKVDMRKVRQYAQAGEL